MILSEPQRRKLKVSLRFIILGISAGIFFVILNDGINQWFPMINGIMIGFLIAVFASIFELGIYERSIRKYRFITVFIVRSLFYSIIIIAVIFFEIGIARMIRDDLDFRALLQNEGFREYVFRGDFVTSIFYALALVIVVIFTRQVSRKLGHGVIKSFITGKYYHPVEQKKIFMFLNIPSSEKIIDQLGRMNFHSFINDIAYDITIPVINHLGIMYQYVEDEIVITWRMKEGIKNANVIRCFFEIKDTIHAKRENYIHKYGISPIFNAAIHCGRVVKGEIGFIKTEIVYHGDVINTTSRILGVCSNANHQILVSGRLLELFELPVIYNSKKCGDIKLKGKKEPMELFTVEEIDMKKMAFS